MPIPGDTPEPASFATVEDVRARGFAVSEADEPKVTELLADVSDAIRVRAQRGGYDIDAAIADGSLTARTAARITVAIAQRIRSAPVGPQLTQQTAGPFTRSFAQVDVAMYLRNDELRDLGIPLGYGPTFFMGDAANTDPVTGFLCSPQG